MNHGNRDAFFNSIQRRYESVETEFGTYRIQSLSELEWSQCENSILDSNGEVSTEMRLSIKPRYIIASVVDDEGLRLFSDNDIGKIQECDSRLTNTLTDAIVAHCGTSKADTDRAEKNSEATGDSSLATD